MEEVLLRIRNIEWFFCFPDFCQFSKCKYSFLRRIVPAFRFQRTYFKMGLSTFQFLNFGDAYYYEIYPSLCFFQKLCYNLFINSVLLKG